MNEDEEQKKKDAAKKKNALRVAKSRAKKKAKALEEAASTSEMELNHRSKLTSSRCSPGTVGPNSCTMHMSKSRRC